MRGRKSNHRTHASEVSIPQNTENKAKKVMERNVKHGKDAGHDEKSSLGN
jgi:hypothetical protein